MMARPARSLVFDGVNEYGKVVSSSVLSFERTDAFSIGIWFKSSSSSSQYLVSKRDSSAKGYGALLRGDLSGILEFGLINTVTTLDCTVRTVSTGWNDGEWHFAIVTSSGTGTAAGLAVYVDGVSQSLSTLNDTLGANSILNTAVFNVATRTSGGAAFFSGNLAHAAVWDRILTAAEVFEAYNLGWPRNLDTHSASANLVGWWPLGEVGTWPYVLDLSGSENTLELINMETGDISTDVPEGPLPYSTKSLLFGGTDEYVTMGDVLGFERTDAFSISCWVKTASAITEYLVTKFIGGTFTGYALAKMGGGTFNFKIANALVTNSIEIETISYGWGDPWCHVVATYDGSSQSVGAKIYVNGIRQAVATGHNSLSASILNAASFNLSGYADGTAGLLSGNMDEVSIYDKELSASEVEWLFNNGAPPLSVAEGAPSNLVGYWRCGDNDTSPTITDLSISGNDGTMTNMEATDIQGDTPTPFVEVFSLKSLLLDGTDEYVTMGNVLGFDRLDPFSISVWFRTSASGAWQRVVSKQVGSFTWRGYNLVLIDTGEFYFDLVSDWGGGNRLRVATVGTYNDGSWHCATITYSGSSLASGVSIYIDGAVVATSTVYDSLSATILSASNLEVGAGVGGITPFNGNLDEVSIHDKELSQAEVTWIYNEGMPRDLAGTGAPSNLVGWWRMGDGDTYPTLLDNSVNSNNGTMTNMEASDIVAEPPMMLPTVFPNTKSLVFNGTDEYVTMGNVLDKSSSSTFSVSCWFKSSTASTQYLVSKFDATPKGWGVPLLSDGRLLAQLYYTSTLRAAVQTAILNLNDGSWHHAVATFDGSGTAAGIKIYVDGVDPLLEVLSDTLGANNVSNTGSLNLSGYNNGTTLLNGSIDEVCIYGKVLSPAEANWLFNNGRPVSPYIPGAPSSLEAWWRCGDGDTSPTVLDNTPNGYNGTMTNMDSTNIVDDVPVLDYPVLLVEEDAPIPAEIYVSTEGVLLESGADEFPDVPRQYYRMRGWNTVSLDWEVWTSADEPDLTPPVGPCTNISVQVVWD